MIGYRLKSCEPERSQLKVIWRMMDLGLLQEIKWDIEEELIGRRKRKKSAGDIHFMLDKGGRL